MRRLDNKGFTITELALATVIAGLVSVAVVTVTIFFYGSILRGDIESRMTVDSQIILRNIVDELRLASTVRTTNTIADSNEPSGGWNTDSANAILIIATPAIDSSGDFIYDDTTGLPYENEIIYFADGDQMYRRVLANPNATGNSLTTTCPRTDTSCSNFDRLLTDEYDVMNFTFYDQDDFVTTDTILARSVEMNINLARQTFGAEVRVDNTIRVTLRNGA